MIAPGVAMKKILLSIVLGSSLVLASPVAARVPQSKPEITLSFAPVVRKATPAVVNIYAKRIVAAQPSPFANDPFFSEFFRSFGKPVPRVQQSLGSGVILSPDGLVVSNYHVVGGATEIRVALNDRREFDARVLLADKTADLAVLKLVGAHDLPTLSLRSARDIEVGDLVLAIGNPFGVGQTVSSGIISGLARSGGAVGNARAYFIQTDAPINPGNSGGALVDMNGALVGINTSILTKSGGSNGIGFAIPSDLVAAFLKQAKAGNRKFVRPWAGMIGQMVDSNLAQGLRLDRPEGMVVVELHRASPFYKAGLRPGDIIVRFNGQPVNGPAELLYHMTVAGVGAKAKITYVRDGRKKTVWVRMIKAPDVPPRNETLIRGQSPLEGLRVARINPAVTAEMDIPMSAQGVVVLGAEGIGARLGFRRGDIIKEVNGVSIATVADLVAASQMRTRVWSITIKRNGQLMTMRLKV